MFPTAIGSTWDYDIHETQTSTADVFGLARIAATGTANVSGISTSRFAISSTVSDFGGYNQFYAVSSGGVTFYGNDDSTDVVTNQLTPTPEILFPVATGTISNVTATGISFGSGLNGNLTQQISVAGTESVTVGAGVFPQAVKVVTTTAGTVTDTSTNQSVPLSALDTSWYAPGVGLVQEVLTGGVGAMALTQTISARGYKVGASPHGLANPTILAAAGVTPAPGPGQAASSGSNILVLSTVSNRALAYLIGNDGTLLTSVALAGNVAPVLCFDGSNYVSFSYSGNPADSSNADLSIQRVSPTGTLLDPSPGLFISQFAAIQDATPVGIGCGRNQSLVLFTKEEPQGFNTQEHLFGMLVDGNGVPTDTQGFPIQATSNPAFAAVGFDGTNYLVVWQADGVTPGNARGIYATRVSSSGAVLDAAPVLLASGTTFTTAPAVGFDGTNYLVAWGDTTGSTNGIFSIYGRRVAPSGALLDGPPGAGALQISSGVQTNRLGPAIAFNGSEYLVAWIGANGVMGARLTPAGTLSSGVGYEIQISDRGVSSISGPLTATSGPAPQFTWLNVGSSGFSLVDLIAYPF